MNSPHWHKYYNCPESTLWQGRKTHIPQEYFFQTVECIDLTKQSFSNDKNNAFCFLGFCCDQGIVRNQGRPGAAQGPQAIRPSLAKSAIYVNEITLYDAGNIICHDEDLESAQQALGEVVALLIQQNVIPIVLGGGHETAWGHYQGIAKAKPNLDLGIVNFDAHFDLRPLLENNLGTSGSPFFQIAQDRKAKKLDFHYSCLGIQKLANTRNLFNVAKEFQVEYLTAEQINLHEMGANLAFLDHFMAHREKLYVSICLDVFAAQIAPGVSAPQALGLYPWQVISFLKDIAKTKKVLCIDIVELSPPLDIHNRTANLAASLIAEFIQQIALDSPHH